MLTWIAPALASPYRRMRTESMATSLVDTASEELPAPPHTIRQMPTDPFGQRVRLLAIVALLGSLAVMFVWAGTLSPDPAMNNYPGNSDVGPQPEAYVGQEVSIGGTVVTTDPAVVAVEHPDGTHEVTLEGLDESVAEGQQVSAFGTLTDASNLAVENTIVRSPWETLYMYAVSFLGGLWVLGRLLAHWRPDRDRLGFVPRGEHDG